MVTPSNLCMDDINISMVTIPKVKCVINTIFRILGIFARLGLSLTNIELLIK